MRIFVLILMAFITFACQNCPEKVAKKYYEIANQVVNGDTSNENFLKEHLSKSAKQQVDSIPLLMQYNLLAITKKGTLKSTQITEKKIIKSDSVILDIALIYKDQSTVKIQQAMVFQDNQWKLGVSQKPKIGK